MATLLDNYSIFKVWLILSMSIWYIGSLFNKIKGVAKAS
ncbi:hypothetical protein AOB58_915 [Staphylococcus sp. AntiMn-1]|nr:hypothetical protein AOB58_915 [Staphylococcus sp. AntiMn-1]